MSAPVLGDTPTTLVWLSPEPPDAQAAQALASWARSRGITLTAPRDERPTAISIDLGAADLVEDLLDGARDAVAARDGDGVDRATATAEALLRAHPELPQAAWLMAEVDRARSTRWRRVAPVDAEAAEREWLRAEALDRGRVPGIGEVAGAAHPLGAVLALALPVGDAARLDGNPIPSRPEGGAPSGRAGQENLPPLATLAGPHAVVVTSEGAPVWAGWIEVASGGTTLEVDAPSAVPCSAADLSSATLTRGEANAPDEQKANGAAGEQAFAERVRCEAWVAAALGPQPGTLRIALCAGARCGLLTAWTDPATLARPAAPAWTRSPPVPVDIGQPHHWPAWATWGLAGAGFVLGAGTIFLASGALKAAPTATRFVTGGLKTQ